MQYLRRNLTVKEYWEDNRAPELTKVSDEFSSRLRSAYRTGELKTFLRSALQSYDETQSNQLHSIKRLVALAYEKVPLYREKYSAVGFHPTDLKTWEDYHLLPCVTKDELLASFPHECLNLDFNPSDLFATRSSGSSGKTLRILVDPTAILIDTFQGVRQFWLQTGGRYYPPDIVAHVYTVPWWVDSLGGDYQTVFISSLIPPEKIGKILDEIVPDILPLYPSNLSSLLPFLNEKVRSHLKLVVTHSEMSSKEERTYASAQIGCPVLDEYSSEELTRIALELACGHYHLCEDTVRIDVVDNEMRRISTGTGLVVGTNLLNLAMPFIKYVQGDLAQVAESQSCDVLQWRQITKIEGRANDALITSKGRVIPAGTLLDVSYRWMFDTNINIQEFEIVQLAPSFIRVNLVEPLFEQNPDRFQKSSEHLKSLLCNLFAENVTVEFNLVTQIPKTTRKRRPIRRDFSL